jgi:hypothetical protein
VGTGGPRAPSTSGLHGAAQEMGGVERAVSWLGQNRRMSKDYERLAGELGGVRLRGDDTPDGEEVSPHMRVFRRFLSWTLAICGTKG